MPHIELVASQPALPNSVDTVIVDGEIVLAGFYADPLSFRFPPAFMREARIRVAAQWQPADLATVTEMVADGRLSLDGLVTHVRAAGDAVAAYRTAFDDPGCLKMVLDWRDAA